MIANSLDQKVLALAKHLGYNIDDSSKELTDSEFYALEDLYQSADKSGIFFLHEDVKYMVLYIKDEGFYIRSVDIMY